MCKFFPSVLLLLLGFGIANAEPNWPAFRGPTGQGTTRETGLPLQWGEGENVAWKTPIPGRGWSSPVVWGNDIWMTTAIERTPTEEEKAELLKDEKQAGQRQVARTISLRAICIERDSGKQKHNVELFNVENPDAIHLLNSYASPTPVIERDRLYCHFGTFGTTCINTSTGDKVWEREFPLKHAVGPGSSPIVWENLLVLVCDGMEQQYVMAVDKATGDVAWKTDRPPMEGNDGDYHKAFCTPLAVEWNNQPQLLIPGAQWFVSYEPTTGKMLWHINHGKGFSNVAAPVFADGISYLITGFMKPELWAMPVNERGELNSNKVLWEQDKQIPKKSSPALVGSEIYLISDKGVLSCIDINSGDINWTKRLGGNYSASPLIAEGRMYFCSQEGKTTVVRPNANKYEELAESELDGQLMASPVALDGALLIRSDSHLYRIEAN